MPVIAVSGSGGFIGRHFCEAASLAGEEVRCLARETLLRPDLQESLRGAAVMVHLAARAHRMPGTPSVPDHLFQEDNVALTEHVAAAARAAGVRRLVFVSSAGVLGRCSPPSGFTDDSAPAPHDAYTRSKLAAEELLRQRFAGSLEVVIIRPPLVYGPAAPGSFSRIMRLAISRWPLPLGALDAPRSLLSVRNLSDLLLKVSRAREAPGLTMLAGDAETASVADLLRSISIAAGRRPRVFKVPRVVLATALRLAGRQDDFQNAAMPFVLNGSIAAVRLRWTPPFRLQDEIRWTVASHSWASRPL